VNKKLAVAGKVSRRIGPLWQLLLCLLLAASCSATNDWVVREDGIGPIKIGMSLSHLSATLHQKLSEEEGGSENCFYVHAPGHDHISYMIIDDRVVRVDIDAPGTRTATGIQVGDREAHLRQVYGSRAKVTAHQYVDTGHYLTVRSADGRNGIRFETDMGKVTMFYAGTYEAIQYVEGCL
jgi:hypothetical protein